MCVGADVDVCYKLHAVYVDLPVLTTTSIWSKASSNSVAAKSCRITNTYDRGGGWCKGKGGKVRE